MISNDGFEHTEHEIQKVTDAQDFPDEIPCSQESLFSYNDFEQKIDCSDNEIPCYQNQLGSFSYNFASNSPPTFEVEEFDMNVLEEEPNTIWTDKKDEDARSSTNSQISIDSHLNDNLEIESVASSNSTNINLNENLQIESTSISESTNIHLNENLEIEVPASSNTPNIPLNKDQHCQTDFAILKPNLTDTKFSNLFKKPNKKTDRKLLAKLKSLAFNLDDLKASASERNILKQESAWLRIEQIFGGLVDIL